MNLKHILGPLLISSTFCAQATMVRMDIAIGGDQPTQEIYMELFEQQAPGTVANFLNYIENSNGERRYDGTFIHRSVPGFIVQGGGFSYDPANGAFDASLPHLTTDAPILNEFDPSRSNLRGTIAMAKIGSDPDSATSEWFVNLADNSANLDIQNGGFTVFGRVLDADMAVIDGIAALATENQGGTFTDLPVTRSPSATPPTDADLVVISNVETVPTAKIRTDVSELDFGVVQPGSVSQPMTINIQNVGGTDLVIDGILNPFIPGLPFVTVRDECTSTPLPPAASCEMDLQFQPVSTGNIQNVTFVSTNDSLNSALSISVKGVGAFSSATLEIPPESTELDFGDILFGGEKLIEIPLKNNGATDLIFSQLRLTGADAAAFTLAANECTTLTPEQNSCTASITFTPTSRGSRSAALEIYTNDATTPVATIPLSASASGDRDGIPDAMEAGGPNGGDGNRDGIADTDQDNVASLINIKGQYVTLESRIGTRLNTIVANDNPAPDTTPTTSSGDRLLFPHGFFSFFIEDVPPGGRASVTLYLPESTPASFYVKYSPITNSWFGFPFDARTQTGAVIDGNRITLHFIDGGRGDADFFANGTIIDPGGPAIVPTSSALSSGSSGGGCSTIHRTSRNSQSSIDFLILLALLLVYRGYRKKHLQQ